MQPAPAQAARTVAVDSGPASQRGRDATIRSVDIARAGYPTYIPGTEEAEMNDITTAVAALLRDTARAHHQAYLESDGDDPDWPSWYADRLVEPLAEVGLTLTRSVIVFVLVGAARDLVDAGDGWPEAYAPRLIAEAT